MPRLAPDDDMSYQSTQAQIAELKRAANGGGGAVRRMKPQYSATGGYHTGSKMTSERSHGTLMQHGRS